LKVIQIIPDLNLAGAERMCEALTLALRDQGINVLVVSLRSVHTSITEKLERAGFRIIYLSKKLGIDFSIFSKIYHLLKKEKPDVVHTHLYIMPYIIPVTLLLKVPVKVHTVHNIASKEQNFLGRFFSFFFFHLFKVQPVALSDKIQATVCQTYLLKKEKVPIVLNGEDLSHFKVKASYELHNPIRLLHIGRFAEQKNQIVIIEAVRNLTEQGYPLFVQLVGYNNTILGQECRKAVERYNLNSVVQFVGTTDDVRPYLEKTDIFLLPSKFEGVPMTLIEAMACGLPIIASKVGGIPDMLTDNESALLIEGNVNDLQQSIEKMVESDVLRQRLGQGAVARSRLFDSRIMAEKYRKIYEERLQ